MTDRLRDEQLREERRVARKLRAELEPTPELYAKIEERLAAAARSEHGQIGRHRRHDWLHRTRRHLFLTLPAMASVALALFVNIDNPAFDAMRMAEHHVELSETGSATLPITLALHEHDDDSAKIALVVPHGVRISRFNAQSEDELAPLCEAGRCRYEFDHPTSSDAPHVQVHLTRPGSYRMEVEHESDDTRVREVVVIHARR